MTAAPFNPDSLTLHVVGNVVHWQGESLDLEGRVFSDDEAGTVARLRLLANWMNEVNDRRRQERKARETRALASWERY